MQRVLMTGVTGFLGRMLALELLRQPGLEIWGLVRGKTQARPEINELVQNERFHILEGDIALAGLTKDSCGLEFDTCFHLAASTNFSERRRSETFLTNVEGTRNTVRFCEERGVCKFFHVSTAYVCGYEYGSVKEVLHSLPRRFRNAYEESKFAAEVIVGEALLDWTILRPSIILADSRTGEMASARMTYGILKSYHRFRETLLNKYGRSGLGKLSDQPFEIHADPDALHNHICLDDVVRLIVAVEHAKPESRTIFHLCNPMTNTSQEVHDIACDVLGLDCLILNPKPLLKHRIEEMVLERGVRMYRPYMLGSDPSFDQSSLRSLVGDEVVDRILSLKPPLLKMLFATFVSEELLSDEGQPPKDKIPQLAPTRMEILLRYGNTELSYASLDPANRVLMLPNHRGYVSYAVKGRTGVMLGDPLCEETHVREAAHAFSQFCIAQRLNPCAVQVTRPVADVLADMGGFVNRIGDEAIIDLATYDLTLRGRRFSTLRSMRNQSLSRGVSVRESSYSEIPVAEVDAISQMWLQRKVNSHELGLLLRPLPRRDEPGVRKFFAFIGNQLVGVVFFDPLYRDGRVVGYCAEIERYARSPSGIHDLLLLCAIGKFQEEGCECLHLGLAPLAGIDDWDHPAASDKTRRLLQKIRDESQGVYNFAGVAKHKNYYAPRMRPTFFHSYQEHAVESILDVFFLVGLAPPELLQFLSQDTFELFVDQEKDTFYTAAVR